MHGSGDVDGLPCGTSKVGKCKGLWTLVTYTLETLCYH